MTVETAACAVGGEDDELAFTAGSRVAVVEQQQLADGSWQSYLSRYSGVYLSCARPVSDEAGVGANIIPDTPQPADSDMPNRYPRHIDTTPRTYIIAGGSVALRFMIEPLDISVI